MTNYIFKAKYYYGFKAKEVTVVASNIYEVEAYIFEIEYNPNNVLDTVQIYDIKCVGEWNE